MAPQLSTTMSLFASPSSSTSTLNVLTTGSRVVRFDNQCVLIPNIPSKRPKMVTKSYSLPLWKKKSSDSDLPDDSTDDSHLTFKVPVPSFMTRTRSQSRGRSADLSQPLSSCLVNSDTPNTRPRRPSVSLPPQHKCTTVPLRACCPDCVNVTEECLREGELWQEKFSRGAHRRRSTSLDTGSTVPVPGTSTFTAVVTSSFPEFFALNVDEVDKRRRSHDSSDDAQARQSIEPSTVDDAASLPIRKSPILEEDEDQLFPLPSPRRTPNASPSASPIPTPNASTASLTLFKHPLKPPFKPLVSPSRDSLPSASDDSPVTTPVGGLPLTPDVSPEPLYHIPASLRAKPSPVVTIPPPLPPAARSRAQSPSPPPASACAPTPPPSPLVSRPRNDSPETSSKRRPSFSIPSPTALLKASAGALKGVNSFGSAGWA